MNGSDRSAYASVVRPYQPPMSGGDGAVPDGLIERPPDLPSLAFEGEVTETDLRDAIKHLLTLDVITPKPLRWMFLRVLCFTVLFAGILVALPLTFGNRTSMLQDALPRIIYPTTLMLGMCSLIFGITLYLTRRNLRRQLFNLNKLRLGDRRGTLDADYLLDRRIHDELAMPIDRLCGIVASPKHLLLMTQTNRLSWIVLPWRLFQQPEAARQWWGSVAESFSFRPVPRTAVDPRIRRAADGIFIFSPPDGNDGENHDETDAVIRFAGDVFFADLKGHPTARRLAGIRNPKRLLMMTLLVYLGLAGFLSVSLGWDWRWTFPSAVAFWFFLVALRIQRFRSVLPSELPLATAMGWVEPHALVYGTYLGTHRLAFDRFSDRVITDQAISLIYSGEQFETVLTKNQFTNEADWETVVQRLGQAITVPVATTR